MTIIISSIIIYFLAYPIINYISKQLTEEKRNREKTATIIRLYKHTKQ